jgi:hypothetical protein
MAKRKKTDLKPVVQSRKELVIEPVLITRSVARAKTVNPIKSEKDFISLLNNIDDTDYLKTKFLKFDGMTVKIKLRGDSFESSLPGSLIIGLAQYQEKIYRIYLQSKYGADTRRKITPEEAKPLEIKVTIKEGSTEAIIELAYKVLKEAISTMPPDQVLPAILGLAGIVVGGICLHGIGSKVVAGVFKSKRKTLAQKKAQSKDEVEKKKLEVLETAINTAIEGMRAVSAGIVNAEPSRVAVNGKAVSTDVIKSIADELAPETPDVLEEQSVLTGTYRIQRITLDFKKDTASADVFDIESGDPIHGIMVQPKSISDGSYRVLKTAQDQRDVKLQLIVTKRNDRIHRAVLDKILE